MKWRCFQEAMPSDGTLIAIKFVADGPYMARYTRGGKVIFDGQFIPAPMDALWLEIPDPMDYYREAEARILAAELTV